MKAKQAIERLSPYQTTNEPYRIKLDANEGKNILFPNGIPPLDIAFEQYPDDHAALLRNQLSNYWNIPPSMILEGNGSSELIELLIKTFVEPDESVVTFEPTFSMYRIYCQIASVSYQTVPVNKDFSVNVDALLQLSKTLKTKIIFLCSPNNPTGYQIPRSEIIRLLQSTDALVVVDEAYMEFADQNQSVIQDIKLYPNLVVLRTFSKAYGLASIRLGYAIAQERVIASLSKVKSPYHVNELSQAIGAIAITKSKVMEEYVESVIENRVFLQETLNQLGFTTFPARGNFIWAFSKIANLSKQLSSRGILIRTYSFPWEKYYRITVGSKAEINQLILALKEIIYG